MHPFFECSNSDVVTRNDAVFHIAGLVPGNKPLLMTRILSVICIKFAQFHTTEMITLAHCDCCQITSISETSLVSIAVKHPQLLYDYAKLLMVFLFNMYLIVLVHICDVCLLNPYGTMKKTSTSFYERIHNQRRIQGPSQVGSNFF